MDPDLMTDDELAARAAVIVPSVEWLELRDQVMALLWQHYGYFGDLSEAHPVTIDYYRVTADDVLDLIEAAGYRLVKEDAAG